MGDWVAALWNRASPTGHNANKPTLESKPELERRATRERNVSMRQAGGGGECKGRIGVGPSVVSHMPVNTFKLSASHSHNLLNQKHSTKELGQGDIILKSIIFESSTVPKNPGVGQMTLSTRAADTLGPNPNPNHNPIPTLETQPPDP